MFILGNLLYALARVTGPLITLYTFVVFVRILLSWVNPDPYNPIVRGIASVTDPVFYYIRKWLPFTRLGPIDFAPFALLLALQFLNSFLTRSLLDIAARLR